MIQSFMRHGNLSVMSLISMLKPGITSFTQSKMLKECNFCGAMKFDLTLGTHSPYGKPKE